MSRFSLVIGILIAIALLVPAQAQEDGLVAEWNFDEGAGNVLKDSSGNGNDGTIYGATWVDGKFGKALSFDGVNDYVKFPKNSLWNFKGDFSIEFWINPMTVLSGNIIGDYFINGASTPPDWQLIYISNCQCVSFWRGSHISATPTNSVPANTWSHVILTRNSASSNNLVIYVNGIEKDITTFTPAVGLGFNLWIGIDGDEKSEPFKGIIDEIRIYNRALTAEKIKSNYEQGPIALSFTKTAYPQSIKQNQTTTITLTIKNTGTTEIKDIEIADTVPSDLIYIGGEISKKFVSLQPKDSREIIYSLQSKDAGTFNLNPATATYADNKGNYHMIKSKPASIEVIATIFENTVPTPKPTDGNVQSASVNLHGEKTDVALGENVLLKLSAVNIIGNPTMHVQVIIIPPNGWSVTSSEFSKSGAGQYTTMYDLKPEDGSRDIEVKIMPNQIGDNFEVKGRIIYYFGDDLTTREDHTLNLPIKVRAVVNTQTPTPHPTSPGFGLVIAFSSVILVWYLRIRKWK